MGDSRSTVRHGICPARRSAWAWRVIMLEGLLALAALVVVGCNDAENKKAALTDEEIQRLTFAPKPVRPDELMVVGESITCDDIITSPSESDTSADSFKSRLEELARVTTLEQFMEVARPQMRQRLNSRIANIVLYQRARRELGEKADETLDNATETELRSFVLEHGGNNAQADEALNALGMNRTTFKEYKKKQILARYSISSKLPKNSPITYSEMMAAYDQMKDAAFVRPGEVEFRLIDIQIAKIELDDPNEDPLQAVKAARTLAEKLVTRICAGEDFGKLAEEYSHGFRRSSGGLWTARDPESLAEPYTVLAEYFEKLEPGLTGCGSVAGPIPVPGHAFIVKLEKKREKAYRPLTEVQEQVEERIRTERRLEALDRLDKEVAEQTGVADTGPFLDDCLKRLHQAANSPPAAP